MKLLTSGVLTLLALLFVNNLGYAKCDGWENFIHDDGFSRNIYPEQIGQAIRINKCVTMHIQRLNGIPVKGHTFDTLTDAVLRYVDYFPENLYTFYDNENGGYRGPEINYQTKQLCIFCDKDYTIQILNIETGEQVYFRNAKGEKMFAESFEESDPRGTIIDYKSFPSNKYWVAVSLTGLNKMLYIGVLDTDLK